jgi:hypothetical protein
MTNEALTITIDPESELGKALNRIDELPVVLNRGGALFQVIRANDDLWSDYDPKRFRTGLRAMAGTLTPEEGERLKELIYRGREEGTRPPDRP